MGRQCGLDTGMLVVVVIVVVFLTLILGMLLSVNNNRHLATMPSFWNNEQDILKKSLNQKLVEAFPLLNPKIFELSETKSSDFIFAKNQLTRPKV